ncbi:hypothetical protein [Paenibacillus roseipurpureus]|uniref:Uncharacterized protein n=1 Tax=Paenibacillus roseopurpureus TaxID=2918901 RepID=A0AA96LVI9_9BACL|nr:hypothetical protein [Paenibacillus sp. MBLB1832]WNR46854.1 hypothetical protein MJB10_12425 [Paenibacillus sp. MBLB1832]
MGAASDRGDLLRDDSTILPVTSTTPGSSCRGDLLPGYSANVSR